MSISRTALASHDLENPRDDLHLQLSVPLIAGEENHITALRILHAIEDKSAAIQWRTPSELGILVMSLFASIASASVCKSFSDNLVQGFLKDADPATQNIAVWCIATPAISAQFSFALNSTLTLGIKVKRYLVRTSKEDIAQEKFNMTRSLAIVLPTLFGGIVMSQKAFEDAPPAIAITISTLRAIAALGANMDFYLQRKKNLRGNKNIPIIRLLLETQQRLNQLAQHDGQEYLRTVSRARLIQALLHPNLDAAQDELTQFVQTLADLFPPLSASTSSPLKQRESKWITYPSLFLGGLTSLINWKASSKVPGLFGMQLPHDFTEVISAFSWDYMPGFLLGAIFFGLPSAYVNTAINSIACARLFNALSKVKNNIKDQGILSYLASFTKTDVARLAGISIFSMGYGLSNGGSGYLYPFIDEARIPNGIFAAIVFTAIGFMSLDSSCNNMSNAYHRQLLTDLGLADDPEAYIASLSADKQQKLLVLVNTFLNASVDTLLDEFNALTPTQINAILPKPLTDTLAERFGTMTAADTPQPPVIAQPSRAGLFAASASSRPVPRHNHIPRVISTNNLTAPSEFLAQITSASRGPFFATSSMPILDEESASIQEPIHTISRSYSPPPSHKIPG